MSWIEHSACIDAAPETFFPIAKRGTPEYEQAIYTAKLWCTRCPVVNTCLKEHLTEEFGVFGGMTPEERKTLRLATA